MSRSTVKGRQPARRGDRSRGTDRNPPRYLGPAFLATAAMIVLFGILPIIVIAVIGLAQGTVPPSEAGGILGSGAGFPLLQPPFWLLWIPAVTMLVLAIVTMPLPARFPSYLFGARFDMSVISLVGAGTTLAAAGAYGGPQAAIVVWAVVPWTLAIVLFAVRGLVEFIREGISLWRPPRPAGTVSTGREDAP